VHKFSILIQKLYPITVTKIVNSLIKLDKGTGKANAVQTWTGPEGSSRLELLDFMTVGT